MRKRWQEHRDYGDLLADYITFRTLVTPKLLVFIHFVVLVGAAFGTIGEVWWATMGGGGKHYVFAFAFAFGYLLWRISVEGVMILYLIHERLVSAGNKLDSVDDRLRLLNKRAGVDE